METLGDITKKLYQSFIFNNIEYIRSLNKENTTFQRIREKHHREKNVGDLCRGIIYENSKMVEILTEEISNDRRKIKEIK